MTISEFINRYPTKHKEGFTDDEIKELISLFDNDNDIDIKRFNTSMRGHTCMMVDGDIVNYHCDIIGGLHSAIIGNPKDIYVNNLITKLRETKLKKLLDE